MSQNPVAAIRFKKFGTVYVQLYPEHAPETVRNFVYLAGRRYYDGLRVHQVIPRYMLQGGCPQGRGNSGPGYGIYGEFSENGFPNPLKHTAGALTMVRQELPNTAGSIFALLTAGIPAMDGRQAVFGYAVEGLDRAQAVTMVRRDSSNRPYFRPTIESVRVETFGVIYEKPRLLDLQRKIISFF